MRDLRPLFDPRSVAVLGASDDPTKWGQWISVGALRGAHRRDVWLVNRKGGQILGREAYTSLAELPGAPELVVISLPASAFEQAIDASLAAGAKAIVAITAGLGEIDEAGKAREAAVAERVRAAGAVMVGPNCLGVYDATAELDVGSNYVHAGSIGIISQSGNLALEAEPPCGRVRRRSLALHLARQPGRHRCGGARRVLRGRREHARDRRLLRGLS